MRRSANPEDYRERFARTEDFECLKWLWEDVPEVKRHFGGWVPFVQSIRGEARYTHRTTEARDIARRAGVTITFDGKGMANFTRPGRR
jgi:hypothetical protein